MTLVTILAAVNLARLTGRGFLVAQSALAGLVLAAVFGLLPAVDWWRRVASVIARGQCAAMGFIIAAKALARHKRFHEDPEFAESFLVGTLAGVLVALAVAELLRGIGVAAP